MPDITKYEIWNVKPDFVKYEILTFPQRPDATMNHNQKNKSKIKSKDQGLQEARLSSWTTKCTSPSSFNARLHIAVTTSDGPSLSATITTLRPRSFSAYESRSAAGTKHHTSAGSMESSICNVLLHWSSLPADLIALTHVHGLVTPAGGLVTPAGGLHFLGSGTTWAELMVGATGLRFALAFGLAVAFPLARCLLMLPMPLPAVTVLPLTVSPLTVMHAARSMLFLSRSLRCFSRWAMAASLESKAFLWHLPFVVHWTKNWLCCLWMYCTSVGS